jgi:hypothetical protein
MYAAAFIGDQIIDLAGWDQGPAAETSNLNISYSNQFQSVSYIGGIWGRQFARSGSMATVSFDSRFSCPDYSSDQFQRWASYFMMMIPIYFSNQTGCTFKLSQPYPTAMGTRQLETATGSGNVVTSGNVIVTVTAKGMDSPQIIINVPVTTGQTPSQWMAMVRAYFMSAPQVAMNFDVYGTGNNMQLLVKSPYAENDPTLNIAIAPNGTGITASPISVNTTSGVSFFRMSEITFYDASVSVAASQIGQSVLLNTSVTGRLVAP